MAGLIPFAFDVGRYAYNRYAGRGRGSRRGRSRKSRGGMRRSGARVASRPPTRSVMQGSFSGSIRNYFTVDKGQGWVKDLTFADILGDNFASLKTQFAECRVLSLRCYYEPEYGTNTSGSYAAALIDGARTSPKKLSYGTILALPGSTTRKMYQSVGLHWKWTEPSDAEFEATTSTRSICCVFLSGNSTAAEVSGELVVDASIVLRTQSSAFSDESQLERMIRVHDWPSDVLSASLSLITERLEGMNLVAGFGLERGSSSSGS